MTRSLAVGGLLAAALFVGTAESASAQYIAPYGGGYGYRSGYYQSGYVVPGYVTPGYGYSVPYTPFTPVWGVPRVYPSYPAYSYGFSTGSYGGYGGGYGGGYRGGYGYPGHGYNRGGFSFGFSSYR